jgi:tRNA U34 5-methylaminomethyl-2-thiouridine-forming methyltransferase MnmC
VQRNIIVTKDGSHSVVIPEWKVWYHSVHGAIQESQHVFLKAGLQHWFTQHPASAECIVFEMGFGTGLNALLTLMAADELHKKIMYETVEAFPLETALVDQLNYCQALQQPDLQPVFRLLHNGDWNKPIAVTDFFTLKKVNTSLINFSTNQLFNLIYYDAFAPNAQPELWTEAVFEKMFAMLASGGMLVTYCSKGVVRRALQATGFTVEKIPGPPGKREMIRATKA